MRIPTFVVLVFSGLLLIGAVQGTTVTIGPTQGHVEYKVTIINQGATVASFFLNESAQPTGQNGIVLVTANLLSTARNFTYSRALNTSSFPEVFPYLLGISNQSLSYHAYGVSLTLRIVNLGLLGAAGFAAPSIFKRLKSKPATAPATSDEPGGEEKPSYWVD